MMGIVDWAEQIHKIWNCTIYLCGSAQWKEDPRDWDVRVELPDNTFKHLIGHVDRWIYQVETGKWIKSTHKWSDICVKFSRDGASKTKRNIDFQFYPLSHCEKMYEGKQKTILFPRSGMLNKNLRRVCRSNLRKEIMR